MAFKTKDRTFLKKLLEILENQEYQEIIQWNENGTKFLVHSKLQVEQIILPAYFKHSSYQSFLSQTNMVLRCIKANKLLSLLMLILKGITLILTHSNLSKERKTNQIRKCKICFSQLHNFWKIKNLLFKISKFSKKDQFNSRKQSKFKSRFIFVFNQIYKILCTDGQSGGGVLFKFIMKFLKSIVNKDFKRYLSFLITSALESTEEYYDTDPGKVIAKYDFKKEFKVKHEPLNPNTYVLAPDMFKPFGQYQPFYYITIPTQTRYTSPNYSPLALMYKLEGEKEAESEVESY